MQGKSKETKSVIVRNKKLKPRITVAQPRKSTIPIKVEYGKKPESPRLRKRSGIGAWYKDRKESKELKLQEERKKHKEADQKQFNDWNKRIEYNDLKLREEIEKVEKAYHKQLADWYKIRKQSIAVKLQEEKEKERLAYQKQLEELKKAQLKLLKEEKEKQRELERRLALERLVTEAEEKKDRKLQKKLALEILGAAKKEKLERLKQEKREKEVLEQLKALQDFLSKPTRQLRMGSEDSLYDKDEKEGKKWKNKIPKTEQWRVGTENTYFYDQMRSKEKKQKKLTKAHSKMCTAPTCIVKNYVHYLSWKERLYQWFYRKCCEFYCYLTCALAVIFVLIVVI